MVPSKTIENDEYYALDLKIFQQHLPRKRHKVVKN